MAIIDTYKYGSLYVDAAGTIARLEEEQRAFEEGEDYFEEIFPGETREYLKRFEDSHIDYSFDEDYPHGSIYRVDGQHIPLILLGHFGGYPGDSIDRANSEAAKEWASDKSHVYAYSSWFGGCEMVSLYFVLDEATTSEEVDEAIDMVEGFADYPVLDEDLWCRYQSEEWETMISEMIADVDRDREYADLPVLEQWQSDLIRSTAGEFYGYWEDGYFPSDKWDEIVDNVLTGEVQLHQEDKLF